MSIYRGKTTREVYLANLLYDAIDDEDIKSIKQFLEKGADCNIVLPKQGIAPFHLVIGRESEEFANNITSLLLQNKADPNVRTNDGLTPLHIAAAYGRSKILHSLLCCGGNPDLRDANYKKPIDYSHEYDHKECVDLLLSFMEKPNLFQRHELSPAFNIVLEKIVVENGGHTGQFELVQEYKTEPLTQKNLASLQQLPETDTTEYIMKWCQNHLQVTPPLEPPEGAANNCANSLNNSDFRDSSCDESDGGKSVNYKIKQENITFRKKYNKVRKVSNVSRVSVISDNVICTANVIKDESVASNNVLKESRDASLKNDEANCGMFTTLKEFSRESGIVTLPNSKTEDNINLHSVNVNHENVSPNAVIQIVNNTAAESSDYRTCSPCNGTIENFSGNLHNLNICEMNNDLAVEEVKSRRSSTKSEGVLSTDISFVSVSEVYKYIDEEEGIVLYERRFLKASTSDYAGSVISSLSSKLSLPTSIDYDTDTLRKELTTHGYNPGPITFTTKRVYLRKLKQIKRQSINQPTVEPTSKIYSIELEKTLRNPNWLMDISTYKNLEESLVKEFSNPNPSRRWREGVNKTSFTYLLLDPRITNNLPCRAELTGTNELWQTFLSAIFYVGKGKRSRPYSHLYEAVSLWKEGKRSSPNKKLDQILSIWNDNSGVVCLHIFQNVIPVEAYTREASIISALKLENLRNVKGGEFYGVASTWSQKQKKLLGVYLLHKAMMIFINEGERQLCPADIE